MPSGPLENLHVVELAGIGPGPMCAMLLADLGARVIRVDRIEPGGSDGRLDPRFEVTGRGRRSIALDLKHPQGKEIVLRLVDGADVLIEGFRPGVTERLGIGPEPCLERNRRLIYGRMTGFGQDGVLAGAAGHDLNYIALTGALHAIGPAGGAPLPPLNLVGDYGGGALYLALGILSALWERHRSGEGQVVDAAMVEGAASLMAVFFGLAAAGLWGEDRGANLLDGGAPYYAVYQTRDGLYISVAAIENKFFAELARRIGLDPSFVIRQNDRSVWPAMRRALGEIFRTRTRAEWCALLEGTDACFAPVLSMAEAPLHPHNVSRNVFVRLGGYEQPGPAPRFSRSRPPLPTPAPHIGAHTGEILSALGYSSADVDSFRAAGVIK